MTIPLEIVFRDIVRSQEADDLVRARVDRLHRYAHGIVSCRVAIERPHRHQHTGQPYRVRVEVKLPPNHDLVAAKEDYDQNLGLSAVIADAFDAMERQLKGAAARRRGQVKTHEEPTAIVVRLFLDEGYGFVKSLEGPEIYFHRNSVLHGDFERLEIGTAVRFAAETGEKGLQASTIQVVESPGVRRASDQAEGEAYVPLDWRP